MTDDSLSGYLARGWALVALHAITSGGLCTCEPTRSGEPCASPGKHPLYENWQKIPIREAGVWQAIAGWRSRHGLGTNVGLATGVHSGVFALDHDPKNVTDPAAVQAFLAALPVTWSQRTGSGGRHWLFQLPPDFAPTNARGTLPDGLDVRGNGGFIVLAPSVSGYGAYEVLTDGTPATPSSHLADAIRPAAYAPRDPVSHDPISLDARTAAYAQRALDASLGDLRHEMSGRNERAFRVAARLHELVNAGWLGYDETLDAYLEAAEQASGNKPEPFGQHEAMHVWENAERRAAGKVAELPASTLGGTALDFPGPRTEASSSSGLGFFAAPGEAPTSSSGSFAGASATAPSLNLPAEFWAARPVLKHVQLAAHSRLVSADVLLHSLLVRLSSLWPHQVRLDTGILSAASVNLFTAVVGPSGAGKSAGVGLAARLLARPHWLGAEGYADDRPLGSGEGMSEVYMGFKTVTKKDEHGTAIQEVKTGAVKTEKVRAQVRHNALLHADEGEVLAKVMERQGSTLGVELRRAWSGGTIGQSNGRSETTRVIEGGRYSMGLVVGFQLNTVQRLLTADETTSGTTQRFLFCWALDPSIARERLPDPGPLNDVWPARAGESSDDPDTPWLMPPGTAPPETDLRTATFDQAILDLLWEERYGRATTMPSADEELASQGPVTVLKVAALLAYLDRGRRHVTEEDWRLATMVWEASCRVRDHAIETGRRAAGKAAAADRERHAEREGAAEVAKLSIHDADQEKKAEQGSLSIARWAAHQEASFTRSKMLQCVKGAYRSSLGPDCVTRAVERQWVVELPDGKYERGPVRVT